MRHAVAIGVVALGVVLAGNAHALKYYVSVNALAASGAEQKKSYVLLPEDQSVDTKSLQYQEYETQAKLALSRAGFKEAPAPEEADVVLFLSFGIGPPQELTRAYTIPVWGQTGVASSQTTGTINTFGNTSTISATTTNTPTYGIKGYQSGTMTNTVYTRFARFTAVDYKHFVETKEVVQVWQTVAVSTGSTGDLRQIFPVLLAKSYPYFGKRTERALTVTVNDRNKDLRTLRENK